MNRLLTGLALGAMVAVTAPAQGISQGPFGGGGGPGWSNSDPVLHRIWEEAMENSHLERLGHELLDGIGPRLTGSPASTRSVEWAVRTLQGWGIQARPDEYGTWRGWERGITHIDLLSPRIRSLEGTMLAWSPGTSGPVEGEVIVVPEWQTEAEFEAWLATEVRGKFVATGFPQPTCRPNDHFSQFGSQGALQRLEDARDEARQAHLRRVPAAGLLRLQLDEAGALGILESNWQGQVGVNRIFGTNTTSAVTLDLGCEDYGLVYRLAESGQAPRIRVNAVSEDLGEVPVFNVIGTIPGTELPNEYVMLSAHFDSWDGGSGATDNGTGSILMLETMRIISESYPNPKRTILIGLWGGEEQGLNGSRRFVSNNPEVVENLQALFNQDNGTGRVVNISPGGLIDAGEHWARWLSRIPTSVTSHINFSAPGSPSGGGSDHASFICSGAPGFSLGATSWGYSPWTWHTNRDTYDKVVFEEVRNNAALTAMLVYLASEDAERVPRTRRELPISQNTGQRQAWPDCQPGRTSSGS